MPASFPTPACMPSTRRSATCLRHLPWLLPLLLAACATGPTGQQMVERTPEQVRAEILRRMPAGGSDRAGWAADIQAALAAVGVEQNSENICAVLAVTAQESGLVADPQVPDLPRIARTEIERRAGEKHIPAFMVGAALKLKSADGRSYEQRLNQVRSERDLSQLYEEIIARVPLGKRLFAGMNPVHTAGPMQVSIEFSEQHARSYPYPVQTSLRDEVFTRRGGLYFGTLHLLGYQTPYTRKIYRFADYNAGWYASRNAAFQNAVSKASGIALALDGDLLRPGAGLDNPGKTELALRSLSSQLGLDAQAIRRQLQREDRLDFNSSQLFERVYAMADRANGAALPREILPGIKLESPKITRNLTTAWFAQRVDSRYQQCMRK